MNTPEEQAIIEIVRLNKASPKKEIRRELRIGQWRLVYSRRSKENLWGRFGGGWNWKVGVQAGGSTVIIDLLVASVRIARQSPPKTGINP